MTENSSAYDYLAEMARLNMSDSEETGDKLIVAFMHYVHSWNKVEWMQQGKATMIDKICELTDDEWARLMRYLMNYGTDHDDPFINSGNRHRMNWFKEIDSLRAFT